MKNTFESWHVLIPLDCPKKSQGISGIEFSLLVSGGWGWGMGSVSHVYSQECRVWVRGWVVWRISLTR